MSVFKREMAVWATPEANVTTTMQKSRMLNHDLRLKNILGRRANILSGDSEMTSTSPNCLGPAN